MNPSLQKSSYKAERRVIQIFSMTHSKFIIFNSLLTISRDTTNISLKVLVFLLLRCLSKLNLLTVNSYVVHT